MKSTPCIILQFGSYEDPDTLRRRVEAKAIDPDTGLPVVSMSLDMMAAWLRKNGFVWRFGSSGIWERAA